MLEFFKNARFDGVGGEWRSPWYPRASAPNGALMFASVDASCGPMGQLELALECEVDATLRRVTGEAMRVGSVGTTLKRIDFPDSGRVRLFVRWTALAGFVASAGILDAPERK